MYSRSTDGNTVHCQPTFFLHVLFHSSIVLNVRKYDDVIMLCMRRQ